MAFPKLFYFTITCDKTLIAAAYNNFPYQYDFSTRLAADATLQAIMVGKTEANIAVYDEAGTKRDRIVRYNAATNNLLISWDGATSTSSNKVFRIYIDSSINEINASATFANSNAAHMWGMNNFDNDSTTPDAVGSNTGSKAGAATFGINSKFGNGVQFTANTGTINCGDVASLNSVNIFTYEFMFKAALSYTSTEVLLVKSLNTTNDITVYITTNKRLNLRITNASTGTLGFIDITSLSSNTWYHISMVVDLSQSTATNKIKMYIDGVIATINIIGTLPSTTSNLTGVNFIIGANANNALIGYLDEITQYTDAKDANYITTRYNMFFSPNTMFVLGSNVQPSGDTVINTDNIKIVNIINDNNNFKYVYVDILTNELRIKSVFKDYSNPIIFTSATIS